MPSGRCSPPRSSRRPSPRAPSPCPRAPPRSAGFPAVDAGPGLGYTAPMLDLRHVMDHLEEVQAGLRRRSAAAAETLSPIAELGKKRGELIRAVEAKQAQRNKANEGMAKADKK